jgi:hypothetical protein
MGAPIEGEPTRRHGATQRNRPQVAVEEYQVKGEPHAEGVDAAAAGEQQTRARGAPVEQSEPQKPRAS